MNQASGFGLDLGVINNLIQTAEILAAQIANYKEVREEFHKYQKAIQKSAQKFLQLYPLIETETVYTDWPNENVTGNFDKNKEWKNQINEDIENQRHKRFIFSDEW